MKEISFSTRRAMQYVNENKLYEDVFCFMELYGIGFGTACEMVYDAHTLSLEEYLATYAE